MNGERPPSTVGPQPHTDYDRITAQSPPKDSIDTQSHELHTSQSSHRQNGVSGPANEPHDMFAAARKRTARRAVGEEHNGSADESAPIIRHARGDAAQADYQSISPSPRIAARGAQQGDAQRDVQQDAEREAAEVERREGRWWSGLTEKYGSVELENRGSVARDHLALERTFLAWLRTSLSFASIGIAITQLFRLNTSIASSPSPSAPSYIDAASPQARLRHVGKPLGATFIGVSVVILFIGFHRYFEAQHYVIRGKFPASRGSVMLVSGIAGALILSSLIVILSIAPRAFET